MLAGFERRVAQLDRDLCAPFHQEATQLETELLTIYRFIARGTGQEPESPGRWRCCGQIPL